MRLFHPSFKSLYALLPAMLIGVFSHAQNFSGNGLCAPLAPRQNTGLPPRSQWIENIEARTLYSSTYRTMDGQVIVRYSKRPINYYNASGQLVPIDPALRPAANGWCAADQPFPAYLNTDGSTALTLGKNEKIIFNKNCKVNGQKLSGTPAQQGNLFLLLNTLTGIEKEYTFHENALKYNYILTQPVPQSNADMRFSEELEFPAGYKLVPDHEHGRESAEGWSGDLTLLNSSGEIVSRFMAPLCYDANRNYTVGTYVFKEEGGKHTLELLVSASWLNDPSRAYPVVIDPLVVGPTSTWTGGFMPSCIVPAYNADSIQVTIPAGITITGLFATSSYYADPFTTAVMSQGSMYFSTSCGQTTTFTVPNPTGNTPGTAYLDSFDIHSPLMCCFLSSCSLRTFYLTMHLGRTGPSTGCNTTYIRYDPTTTLWPFSALVVGRTVESFGNGWSVPNSPICSNQCTITGIVYVRYGVPPYTLSHPWATGSVTVGTPNGCTSGAQQHTFTLTIPNCPRYCDTTSMLVVPPPTVTDACGNTVSLPSRTVPLKEAPDVTATPGTITVCSGSNASIPLSSCVTGATINWYGNNTSGTGNLADAPVNNGTSQDTLNYYAYATSNGCTSDTLTIPVLVDPLPSGNFTYTPVPCIANTPANFTDASVIYAGTASTWSWNFGDSTGSFVANPTHTFANPGSYNVCLRIATSDGCIDTVCKTIEVIAPDVIAPNVVTPNGDGVNDLLKFKYLEFFPNNELEIYNRWGTIIYRKSGYTNDWKPSDISNGTYYYVLKVSDLNKEYKGFFEVLQ